MRSVFKYKSKNYNQTKEKLNDLLANEIKAHYTSIKSFELPLAFTLLFYLKDLINKAY